MPFRDKAVGTEFALDDWQGIQYYQDVACARNGDCLMVEADNFTGGDYDIRGRLVQPRHVYLPLVSRK